MFFIISHFFLVFLYNQMLFLCVGKEKIRVIVKTFSYLLSPLSKFFKITAIVSCHFTYNPLVFVFTRALVFTYLPFLCTSNFMRIISFVICVFCLLIRRKSTKRNHYSTIQDLKFGFPISPV